jgi:hypothetical protein
MPLGIWVIIQPAGSASADAADPACRIKVPGAFKPGMTRARRVPAAKLTACYRALRLADCQEPLQLRVTAAGNGKKYKDGPASAPVPFAAYCAPC